MAVGQSARHMHARDEKVLLRGRLRKRRDGVEPLTRARMDAQIRQRVCETQAYAEAALVYTYVSIQSEVDTRELIRRAWCDGKMVAIPRCVPGCKEMRWHTIDTFEGLAKNSFGLEEPVPGAHAELDPAESKDATSIALVPGLAFDREGYRLGYGGGYYDVFLRAFDGISLGLCRSSQLMDDMLPRNAFDVPVDWVITDSEVLDPRA